MARPLHVGSRELKNRLGQYLRQVREGKTVIVTDRGEPIAELRPLARRQDNPEATIWARLIAEGRMSGGSGHWRRRAVPLDVPGVSLSDTVIEDREDRF